eukprot:scaffold9661_cov98-Amphora_coffeaeformis.AAC.1
MITEPSAVDILRNYSNPNSPDFGDAQQIYADLCDHFEGGAIGQVTITELETQLTTLRLNKSWTKSVSHFVPLSQGKSRTTRILRTQTTTITTTSRNSTRHLKSTRI